MCKRRDTGESDFEQARKLTGTATPKLKNTPAFIFSFFFIPVGTGHLF